MNEVFNFQENKSYNLGSGIYLASRNMHTAHFGTDTIPSSGPKNKTRLSIIFFESKETVRLLQILTVGVI